MKAYCCYCCKKKLSGWTGGISGEGKEEEESGHAEDTGKQRGKVQDGREEIPHYRT